MSMLELATQYINRGIAPVPVPYKKKSPILEGLQMLRITVDTAPRYFNGRAHNVGAILGPASKGLTDVDLDCPEAVCLAPYFLPRTRSIVGRASHTAKRACLRAAATVRTRLKSALIGWNRAKKSRLNSLFRILETDFAADRENADLACGAGRQLQHDATFLSVRAETVIHSDVHRLAIPGDAQPSAEGRRGVRRREEIRIPGLAACCHLLSGPVRVRSPFASELGGEGWRWHWGRGWRGDSGAGGSFGRLRSRRRPRRRWRGGDSWLRGGRGR
jgi:hypothetical protein